MIYFDCVDITQKLTISRPGRIHHCMRAIGAASYALDLMIQRVTDPTRKTFGKFLYEHGAAHSHNVFMKPATEFTPAAARHSGGRNSQVSSGDRGCAITCVERRTTGESFLMYGFVSQRRPFRLTSIKPRAR